MGVTVNAVTPGLIETDMVATIPPYLVNKLREEIPMHRMGQPEEVARVVCFLAQDASAYITGRSGASTADTTCDSWLTRQRRRGP
jgi:NAD(P)-dependent dehydrogenase (short-subunit alcohol dehydrogenase family)